MPPGTGNSSELRNETRAKYRQTGKGFQQVKEADGEGRASMDCKLYRLLMYSIPSRITASTASFACV